MYVPSLCIIEILDLFLYLTMLSLRYVHVPVFFSDVLLLTIIRTLKYKQKRMGRGGM